MHELVPYLGVGFHVGMLVWAGLLIVLAMAAPSCCVASRACLNLLLAVVTLVMLLVRSRMLILFAIFI